MKIPIYIDSCAWNYLYDNSVDLKKELPQIRYSIFITKEVEIEILAIPNSKENLKNYIRKNINQLPITTTSTFGFRSFESDGTPSAIQTFSGFSQGTFQSETDRDYYTSHEVQNQILGKSRTKSGLSKNLADASLAVRANKAVILTNENPSKSGPLKSISEKGGYIVSLKYQVEPTGQSIGDYIYNLTQNWPDNLT